MGIGLKLRGKVLLISTVLLVIPYVGYQYVREMEAFLKEGQESSVLAAAQALAGALHDRPALFSSSTTPSKSQEDGIQPVDIYVHPFREPVQLDGYTDDWTEYMKSAYIYGAEGDQSATGISESLSVAQSVGTYPDYLYVLLRVRDERIVYRSPQTLRLPQSDHVWVLIQGPDGALRRFLFTTISSGWMDVHEVPGDGFSLLGSYDGSTLRSEIRIRAEWQESVDGYTVEMRIPSRLVGARLGLAVGDVDDPENRRVERTLATFDPRAPRRIGFVVLPSAEIENVIQSLGRTPGRRIRVLDGQRRVIARGGSLQRTWPPAPINPLYALLLRPPKGEIFQDPPEVARVSGPEVDAAFAGQADTRWRATNEEQTYIVAAAHPIWGENGILGAVVVEETSQGIQTVQRKALAQLFNITLAVCLIGGLTLVLFASRISSRLRRLRDEADAAIDAHGRVTGQLTGSRARDEIGDLARAFSSMMERLGQYNRYLEALASRLSHELRTPIAVVRSSLDNLAMTSEEEESETYRQRAREGLARLETIITRMSEAARLEQTLQSTVPEVFDLARVVSATVDAYRQTWRDCVFRLQGSTSPIPVRGVPDLIVQMLDKLVSNAVEFGAPREPIEIHLGVAGSRARLQIVNRGVPLPQTMPGKLFDSMVSIRPAEKSGIPHLGLGLYIVRLIAEFHEGTVSLENLPQHDGVRVSVELPVISST